MRFDVVELMEKKNVKQLPEGEFDCQWLQEGEEENEYEAWGHLSHQDEYKEVKVYFKIKPLDILEPMGGDILQADWESYKIEEIY